MSPGEILAFAADEGAAFEARLATLPRALVLFKGVHCPYSATFAPHFRAAATTLAGQGWTFVVRELREDDDAAWDAHRLKTTPTVVASERGVECMRLGGRPLLGITRHRFAKWLRDLPTQATPPA